VCYKQTYLHEVSATVDTQSQPQLDINVSYKSAVRVRFCSYTVRCTQYDRPS